MSNEVPDLYDPSEYDRPSVTVDVAIFALVDSDLRILLMQRAERPFSKYWSLPGTFVSIDESLDEAAMRALAAKTGVKDVYTEQLFTFGEPKRDPRMRVITVAYFALVPFESVQATPGVAVSLHLHQSARLGRPTILSHNQI